MNFKTKFDGMENAPRWIVTFLGAYLILDLFALYAWNAAGQIFTVQANSDGTAAWSVTAMSGVAAWLCVVALRSFPSGAPLRSAWILMASAAAVRTAAGIASCLFDWLGPLSPVGGPRSVFDALRYGILIASGPLQMLLLAAGLLSALRVLRGFGFSARLRVVDWAVFAIFVQFTLLCFAEAARETMPGVPAWISLGEHAALCILIWQAMVLRKSMQLMGGGLVYRCWMALLSGIVLTGIGDVVLWAIPHYFQNCPIGIVESFVRIPAAAAFALAPAYQVAAQRRATQGAGSQTDAQALPGRSIAGEIST